MEGMKQVSTTTKAGESVQQSKDIKKFISAFVPILQNNTLVQN